MARGKVQIKKIENPVHRQVTFCKRRSGLLKKAKELSVLCDADVGVLIFSSHGKVYELAAKGTMQELIERYTSHSGQSGPAPAASAHVASQQRPSPSSSSSIEEDAAASNFLQVSTSNPSYINYAHPLTDTMLQNGGRPLPQEAEIAVKKVVEVCVLFLSFTNDLILTPSSMASFSSFMMLTVMATVANLGDGAGDVRFRGLAHAQWQQQ
ncbi:hypothetical protein SAY86_020878 [Trapa natans]|uniref:MADS-box domain-containing protein n=1 Tax=Trapa natans TaxID=22666 RepID=A0AAN7MT05_TRANT|nr:hypothetical protein SAY86_020878 [Trapa natans]